MALKRQLGVKYDTAWMLKHKLLQAMKESDDKQPISGIIQLDDVYWGGERRGGKRGRGESIGLSKWQVSTVRFSGGNYT